MNESTSPSLLLQCLPPLTPKTTIRTNLLKLITLLPNNLILREQTILEMETFYEDCEKQLLLSTDLDVRSMYVCVIMSCHDKLVSGVDLLDLLTSSSSSSKESSILTAIASIAVNILTTIITNIQVPFEVRANAMDALVELSSTNAYMVASQNSINTESTDMKSLMKIYTHAINVIITNFIDRDIINCIIATTSPSSSKQANKVQMQTSLLRLINSLLLNASENYAKFRIHLSSTNAFILDCLLPFHANLIGEVKMTNLSDQSHLSSHLKTRDIPQTSLQNLTLVTRLLAISTFKLKGLRSEISSAFDNSINVINECHDVGSNPQLLASLIKLHVNICGGYGTNWEVSNTRNSGILKWHCKVLRGEGGGRMNVFRGLIKGSEWDGVPVDGSSRGYKSVKECFEGWSDDDSIDNNTNDKGVRSEMTKNQKRKERKKLNRGNVNVNGREDKSYEESKDDHQHQRQLQKQLSLDAHLKDKGRASPTSLDTRLKLNRKENSAKNVIVAEAEAKSVDEYIVESLEMKEIGNNSKASSFRDISKLNVAASDKDDAALAFLDTPTSDVSCEAKSRFGDTPTSDNDSERSFGNYNYESKQSDTDEEEEEEEEEEPVDMSKYDFSIMQLDELDSIFLPSFSKNGPPPMKFICGISNEVMKEPILNPYNSKQGESERTCYDRFSLVTLLYNDFEDANCDLVFRRGYWPSTDVKMEEEDLIVRKVEEGVKREIDEWRGRME